MGENIAPFPTKKAMDCWTLAWHYSEALQQCRLEEGDEVKRTARIYQMGNKHKLPFDAKHQLLLAILLDFPFELWNHSVPYPTKEPTLIHQLFDTKEIDIPAQKKAIQKYNQQFLDGAFYNALLP